jgi:hypothetical protein
MFVLSNSDNSSKYGIQIMVEYAISVPVFVVVLFSLASFGTLESEFGEIGYHGSSRHVYQRKMKFKVESLTDELCKYGYVNGVQHKRLYIPSEAIVQSPICRPSKIFSLSSCLTSSKTNPSRCLAYSGQGCLPCMEAHLPVSFAARTSMAHTAQSVGTESNTTPTAR